MKKIILLFMLLLLTGCKDYTEINDLGIISGMIIDYKDNKYEITTEIITNDKESELQILSTTSTSIDEAIKELSKLTNKKVFIPHLKVLIITDNILKEDIDYYDYFLRNSKSSMNFYVYYIDSKIKDKIFKITNGLSSTLLLVPLFTITPHFKHTSSLSFNLLPQFEQYIFLTSKIII